MRALQAALQEPLLPELAGVVEEVIQRQPGLVEPEVEARGAAVMAGQELLEQLILEEVGAAAAAQLLEVV